MLPSFKISPTMFRATNFRAGDLSFECGGFAQLLQPEFIKGKVLHVKASVENDGFDSGEPHIDEFIFIGELC